MCFVRITIYIPVVCDARCLQFMDLKVMFKRQKPDTIKAHVIEGLGEFQNVVRIRSQKPS